MGSRQEKLFLNAFGACIFIVIFLFLPKNASATTNISGSSTTGVASWLTTTALPNTLSDHTSVVNNGYIYAIGGTNTGLVGGITSTVLYAPINSTGSLGSWSNTTALPSTFGYHASVVNNGYVYVIGGVQNTNVATSTVLYAPINSTGSLGSWSNTTALPNTSGDSASVVNNGYVYLIGGAAIHASNPTSTVLYAPINSTGSLGAWTNATALPTSTRQHSSVVNNGYVYVIGGVISGGSPTSTVLYALINSTGSLGSWTNTTALPTSTKQHTSIVYNGYIYVIGGGNSSPTSAVLYAPINPAGSLGSWSNATSLPSAISDHTSVVNNGYVYTIGGLNASGVTSTTYYAQTTAASANYYAWNDAIGWIDFFHTNNVTVNSNNLVGYASSSAGEVTLDCATAPTNVCGKSQYQVTNDGAGNLSNWGWNDKYGWISFDCHNNSGCSKSNYEAYIDGNGDFQNYAWNDTIGWISFNCANTGGCATSNYKVNTSWASTSTNGYVDSTTYDTGVASGAQLNSVLWHGSQPGGTAVRFQFATSNSSSGPWNFIGTDGTSNTYYSTGPDVSLNLDYSLHNNFRYFRYRVKLFSNTAGTVSPRVDEVIVNWSP